ncbi:PAS domain-containing protein [Paraburkholderia sp. MMS20-SJTR3]|uniref:histidine kinase n=1 Tax=Paraburkholderia sejongensis TaxID=2886946 RepID=A0ABS8JRD1_9BURK|nr:PAS domain-containing protein [Paraburkholderia sp. MMS20-SJTR3]MCC8392466.1 PAS domain-containing protein [Paraburkholderia sp. MMS20-SJTR3]
MNNELSGVADLLPGLVWTALADGRIDDVNHAWCEYSGQSRGEAVACGWSAIAHPDDLPQLLACWRMAAAGGTTTETVARLRRRDGRYRRFVLRARAVAGAKDSAVKLYGLGTDIDELESSVEPADLRQIDLRAIVDSIPAFIGLADVSGGAEYFNRFSLDYLGVTQEDLKGYKAAETVHPDDLPAAIACWARAVETGEPYEFVHRVRRADGEYRWFHVRGLPLRDSDGRIVRWFIVDADIDEAKRAESLLNGEKQLLELVARDRTRPEVLDAFCRLVENTIGGCCCGAMLLDTSGRRIELAVGPSLPSQFVAALYEEADEAGGDGWPTAVRLREPIIAADLRAPTQGAPADWPGSAASYGFGSCWSMPVAAASGELLGAFTLYFERSRAPGTQDFALLGQLTQIASITVERMRSQLWLEQALADVRASEDRMRDIIDAVPSFVWSTAPDGSVDFLNQRWSEYTGMTREEASGFGWTSAVHPDDAAGLAIYWQALIKAGEPGEYEARLRRHDGAYRWFLIRAMPQRDAAGQLLKWYGANTDIEDRKRAEMLLAGEKQLLSMMAGGALLAPVLDAVCRLIETILDGALCSIVLIDPRRSQPSADGAPVLHLQAGAAPSVPAELVERIVGREADAQADPVALAALANLPIIAPDLAHEPRWPAWRSLAAAHGIRSNWSTPIAGGNGTASGTASGTTNGSANGTVAGVLSIMHRQPTTPDHAHENLIARFTHLANIAIESARSEAALKQSEAFLAKAQRLSLTGTFSWRVDTDEIIWSEEIYRIAELDTALAPGFELIFSRTHPEDLPSLNEVLRRQRTDGRDFEHEFRLATSPERVKHVHLVAHATRNEHDQLEYIGALQDITQRRLSEETLGKVRSELTHVARAASLGVLTASIAHEVNQPLAGIVTNASTCLRMLAADPPNLDGARETARRTIRDGHRASDVIQRLRAMFAKRGNCAEPVDLNEAAREVIAMLLGELQRHNVVLQPEFAESLPAVSGDRVQLQQVIVNLLLNAADAMHGVTGRPHLLNVQTGIDADGRVYLAVRDNGAGFDGQDTDRLFEAFYTTKSAGMGIGLSVSRSIIESHGGQLWAVANDGPGACFVFAIPPCADADRAVSDNAAADAAGRAEHHALAADAKESR